MPSMQADPCITLGRGSISTTAVFILLNLHLRPDRHSLFEALKIYIIYSMFWGIAAYQNLNSGRGKRPPSRLRLTGGSLVHKPAEYSPGNPGNSVTGDFGHLNSRLATKLPIVKTSHAYVYRTAAAFPIPYPEFLSSQPPAVVLGT